MKVPLYSLEGKEIDQIALPALFQTPLRPDLIRRAVLSEESYEKQPKGNYRYAGLETSAKYRGRKDTYATIKNRGIPHLPHEVLPKGRFGKVKRVPHAVKGRRAHPPKVNKKIHEEINRKEYRLALASALSYTAHSEQVSSRMGVKYEKALPIVVEDKIEKLSKTKEAVALFKALGLEQLLAKAKEKGSKAPLIVLKEGNKKFAQNLPGVDVVHVDELLVKHLAPGTHPGRLTVFSASAIKEIERRFKE